ncbi:hypothetical protein CABS01_08978 [Colletotrichum abscissum]|uniref:Uncharacterized protein n=3 Tax=Colletotrichum acutatum species complex TaxID=2707335 RepID=A0A9Q8SHQ3_9PEZI|nr:uncharacterized protein CLUP02_02838 [Colletotrichum lupini]XP_060318748.1 uncharacterized protein CCOS01_01906 [Colletotrichum costaricense]XP_060378677.1 uncharacterized protein CTAM01_10723 [Colletotrichum tamarilloi]XP_060400617.1 uncharacterized protein CABS01_08978 [Colletotrichum abscissum]KAI3530780.1 hypothetical protein CSPX01_14609 [Colletotrichum filicis]KAK1490434.1 hypothetical protein CTAM01_10723 [Colletotrichum tamarilloi]KAK1503589.1 hypothetical protein CABS01_08978 [Col
MQFKQSALVILAGLLSLTFACDDAQGNKGVCKPPNFCCAADGFQCVFREECKS